MFVTAVVDWIWQTISFHFRFCQQYCVCLYVSCIWFLFHFCYIWIFFLSLPMINKSSGIQIKIILFINIFHFLVSFYKHLVYFHFLHWLICSIYSPSMRRQARQRKKKKRESTHLNNFLSSVHILSKMFGTSKIIKKKIDFNGTNYSLLFAKKNLTTLKI